MSEGFCLLEDSIGPGRPCSLSLSRLWAGIRLATNIWLTWDILCNQGKAGMNTKASFLQASLSICCWVSVCMYLAELVLGKIGHLEPVSFLLQDESSTNCSDQGAMRCPTPRAPQQPERGAPNSPALEAQQLVATGPLRATCLSSPAPASFQRPFIKPPTICCRDI